MPSVLEFHTLGNEKTDIATNLAYWLIEIQKRVVVKTSSSNKLQYKDQHKLGKDL